MNGTTLLAIAVVFFLLALAFRRVQKSARADERPGLLPEDLSSAVLRIDKWRAEGRITPEDYERLMRLCQEDAKRPSSLPSPQERPPSR
jgi:hypothetical protein